MPTTRVTLKIFSLAVTIIGALASCGPKEKKDPPNPFVVDGTWDVNAVQLSCSDPARCTNSLGILLSVETTTEYTYGYKTTTTTVHRCTSALYEPTKIVSAGHCTKSVGRGQTFFRTVATPGRPSRTFIVTRALKSVFDDGVKNSSDYAALEISEPAFGYDYVKGPAAIPKDLNALVALVINQPGSDNKVFQLDAVDCQSDADGTGLLPFHVSEFTNLFGLKGCRLIGGNSGGPIFARGNLHEVLGVASRSTEGGDQLFLRLKELLGLRPEHLRNRATAGHAGCFDLPGWIAPAPQCQKVDEDLIKSRNAEKNRQREF